MGRPLLSWVGVGVLLAVVVVSAGWDGSPSTREPVPAEHRPATVQGAAYAQAALLVERAALVRGDLSAGFVEVAPRNRAERDAEDYLQLCGSSVPSPRFRVAAHGGVFMAPGLRVRSEVVAYAPGNVERALAELRALPRSCARPVRPRPVQQPSTLALRVQLTDPADQADASGRHELVVLRRGDVLSLVEVDGATPERTLGFARLLGARLLARLP